MVFVKEGHPKSGPIKITYYVSPHEFWFKYDDNDRETVEDKKMQERIERLAEVSKSNRRKDTLNVGDIVIVQCLFMNSKYIRARIDYELNYASGTELILWAIDYGFPMRSSQKLVTKVTAAELKVDNPRVFKATCNGVVPAQPDYDFLQSKTVMRHKPSWSEKAINEFEKIYSTSELLTFHYDCSVDEQHVYGSLQVILCSGKAVDMNEALKKIDEAIDAKNFELEYQSLHHKDYWLQQENYKILENVAAINETTVKALKPKTNRDVKIIDKVNNWDDRNKRLESNRESSLDTNPSSSVMKELPLNEQHSYCSEQVDSKPSRSDTNPKVSGHRKDDTAKSSKHEDEDRFQLPTTSFSSGEQATMVPKYSLKKVLMKESFTTRQPSRVLAHCRIGVPAEPVYSIEEVPFTDLVHKNRLKLNMHDVLRVQSVAWPHLMRGHSLIVINAARTGKTFSYLPAVCSLATEDETLVKGIGPVAIIVCLGSGDVDTVKKNCEELLRGSGEYVTSFSMHEEENSQVCRLLNGMGILVTTIPNLLELIENPLRLFNKKRLVRVVFDEIDAMYHRFGERNVHKVFSSLCTPGNQFILTSKTWHKGLKKFCAKEDLMLCFGAYIEAAIYCNIDITVQSTNPKDQYKHLLSYFERRNYIDERTVIVCNESEEVHKIEKIFRNRHSQITYCHDEMDTEEIGRINQEISRNNTSLGVLVCTDRTLSELCIRNAQHIIHFSLPSNWTSFTQRFVASFDYYDNMVGDGVSAGRPTSVVFVDEQSSDSMPRLVDFMKTRCFAKVPQHVSEWADNKRMEQQARKTNYTPLCNRMLLFGVCDTQDTCSGRHFLTQSDRTSEHLPQDGRVKFEILSIHSPAHFTVRLLEHCSLERNEWQKMSHVDDASALRLQLEMYFSMDDNRVIHQSPKLGDLCIIEDDDEGEKFKRCEVIGIDEKSKEKTVLLIDTNVVEKCFRTQKLYVLPDKFRCYPPQAADIRIAGVVPLDFGTTWDKCLTPTVRTWCDLTENCHFEASIEMTLMRCIWVKSVNIIENLPSIDEELVKFDFKKEIINRRLGHTDKNAFPLLRNLATKCGLLNTKPLNTKPLNTKPVDTKPLDTPRSPIQSLPANNQERGRGRGKVLCESPGSSRQSPTLSRCSILDKSTKDDILNEQIPVASPKIQRKPAKRWAELTPDKVIEVDIGEFYAPDLIYVLLASEFESFQRLRNRISDFTIVPSNLRQLIDLEVGSLCLAHLKENSGNCNDDSDNDINEDSNDYRRALILRVNESVADIFLVDFGVEEPNVSVDDLIVIPEEFITSLPFQAIRCNMVGIRSTSHMSSEDSCLNIYNTLNESKNLSARCTENHSVSNDLIRCNSYDVVFFDKDLERNLNQFVVENQFADYDPETKYLVDVEVEWDYIQFDDDDQWDVYQLQEFLEGLVENANDRRQTAILNSIDESNERTPVPSTERDLTSEAAVAHDEARNTSTSNVVACQLESPGTMPHITWRQTESMVRITISALDVKDYSLKVGSRYVQFCFVADQKRYENILNLFGCVDAKYTSHEIRGLNIVLRLKKTLAAQHWPRLEKWPGRNQFIKCVDECYDSDEDSGCGERKFLPLASDADTTTSSDDEYDEDDNAELLNCLEI